MQGRGGSNDGDDVRALNQALVDELKSREYLRSPHIEAALRAVPRHLFVPGVPLEQAYSDRVFPIKKDRYGRWLSSASQPSIIAIMLEQLDLGPGHDVLEIGAGTGYNAALMAHIVGETGEVLTVDIDEDLVEAAHEHLAAAGVDRVRVVCADGGYGYPEAAPYDRIILTVGASDILPAWMEQMKPDGRLVLPLSIHGTQQSIAFERAYDHLTSLSVSDCGFMMLRGAFAVATKEWIPLGPDPALLIGMDEEHPIDTGKVYRWLTGTHQDWKVGVEVTLREVTSDLTLWLWLHEPGGRLLAALGDMADRHIVPPLVESRDEPKSVSTGVLVGDAGLAALMRPPSGRQALDEQNQRFELSVRQFGSDDSLAHRLVRLVRSWDDAGRPSSNGLRVRAFRKDVDYTPAENEFVVEKEWTRLVLDWPQSRKSAGAS